MNNNFIPNKLEISELLKLSDENLRLAKLELKENFLRGAVSKSYYVFLHAARALLLSQGIIATTHGGTIIKFSKNFILTGKVDKEYGRWFNRALRARQEADYEALKKFTHSDAEEAILQAEKFLTTINELLKI